MPIIYKIVSQSEWQVAESNGQFRGAEIDLTDGYIHFSTAEQVAETAAKHFARRADLLLVAVESNQFGDDLKWEPSRGGALFPHLYVELNLSQVKSVRPLPLDEQGRHRFESF